MKLKDKLVTLFDAGRGFAAITAYLHKTNVHLADVSTELSGHAEDTVKHITAAERTVWNEAAASIIDIAYDEPEQAIIVSGGRGSGGEIPDLSEDDWNEIFGGKDEGGVDIDELSEDDWSDIFA